MIVIPLAAILAPANFRSISDCLQDDGVIAYPTDTLYGLGGSFYSLPLVQKIDRLKNRDDSPYSVAAGSLAMLESLAADIPEAFYDRWQKLLPGKFTFLFKSSPKIETTLLKNSGKIGIRIPGLPPLLQFIEKIGTPLVSTSVNRSGEMPLNDPQRIAREFPEIDLLIDGGVLPLSLGSTLVDITVTPPRIIRHGDDLEKAMSILDQKPLG